MDSTYSIKEIILLTGAGFTKNFGGYLAEEMWNKIFNHVGVQANLGLRNEMRKNFDYEDLYHKVLQSNDGRWSEPDRKVMQSAVIDAYGSVENNISNCPPLFRLSQQTFVDDFLFQFFGKDQSEKGFVFTLNQDLFIERYWPLRGSGRDPKTPGMKDHDSYWFNADNRRSGISRINWSQVKPILTG